MCVCPGSYSCCCTSWKPGRLLRTTSTRSMGWSTAAAASSVLTYAWKSSRSDRTRLAERGEAACRASASGSQGKRHSKCPPDWTAQERRFSGSPRHGGTPAAWDATFVQGARGPLRSPGTARRARLPPPAPAPAEDAPSASLCKTRAPRLDRTSALAETASPAQRQGHPAPRPQSCARRQTQPRRPRSSATFAGPPAPEGET